MSFRFLKVLRFAALAVACAICATACPTVAFQAAYSATLTPTASSHIVLLKQPDNSWTAYELANTSPYTVLNITPHFEKQLTVCGSTGALPDVPAGATPGLTAMAPTKSGNWLIVSTASGLIDAAEFDGKMNLVSESQYPVPPMPGTVTLADVNGDGNPDIVVPLLNIRYISIGVFIGNGGASFQPFVPYAISDSLIGYSASVVVGDVNGDHKPDIVVATRGAVPGLGKVSVFEGNGDGTFQPEIVALSGLSQPVSLVLADLNGDNKPDLIFTQIPTHPDPEIYVALGAGNSAFSAPSAVFPASEAVAVADMNGDGIPDIVTNTATILLGDGKGGFSPSPGYATAGVSPGDATGQVIVTDFDGDGLVDIVIADGSAAALSAGPSGSITVLFGRPGGAFFGPPLSSAPTISSTYSEIVTLPAADFNNDGIPDLASADIFGNINVLQGTANGFFKFVFASTLPGASGTPSDVVTGDFNHDGNIDFAVVSSQAVASGSGSVTVFPGKGDGTFQSPVTTPAPLGAFAAIPADFNGDGKLDLAVLINQENSGVKTTQSRVVIFSGNGDGTFTAGSSYPVNAGAQAITAGDFNRDGKQDLAVVSVTTGPDNQDGDVLFLSGRGDGTFTVGVDTVITGAASDGTVLAPTVTAADFNHDGNPDLVVSLPYPGAMVVLLGRGDGTFQTPVTYGSGFDFVTVGDLDGDGIPDLIATGSGQTGYFSGNGDGTFQPEAAFFGLSGPVAVADFNGDGKLDLAGLADGVLTGIVTLLNTSQAQSLKVVSGASFTAGPLAPDSIASVFGAHLATEIPSATSISVLDASGVSRPASLFFVSPAQVNLLIPDGTAAGAATLSATAFDTKPQTVQIQIVPVAPALFTLDSASLAAAYTVSVGPGSAQTDRAVYAVQAGNVVPAPINVSPSAGQVYLILYGTAIRNATQSGVHVTVSGLPATVTYAGAQSQFPGLDLVNILLPSALAGSGNVAVVLTAAGIAANTVRVSIQ